MFPTGFDPGKVEQLRFGLNPERDEITYWLRNIRIYYGR